MIIKAGTIIRTATEDHYLSNLCGQYVALTDFDFDAEAGAFMRSIAEWLTPDGDWHADGERSRYGDAWRQRFPLDLDRWYDGSPLCAFLEDLAERGRVEHRPTVAVIPHEFPVRLELIESPRGFEDEDGSGVTP
jgi:hypothetical protein